MSRRRLTTRIVLPLTGAAVRNSASRNLRVLIRHPPAKHNNLRVHHRYQVVESNKLKPMVMKRKICVEILGAALTSLGITLGISSGLLVGCGGIAGVEYLKNNNFIARLHKLRIIVNGKYTSDVARAAAQTELMRMYKETPRTSLMERAWTMCVSVKLRYMLYFTGASLWDLEHTMGTSTTGVSDARVHGGVIDVLLDNYMGVTGQLAQFILDTSADPEYPKFLDECTSQMSKDRFGEFLDALRYERVTVNEGLWYPRVTFGEAQKKDLFKLFFSASKLFMKEHILTIYRFSQDDLNITPEEFVKSMTLEPIIVDFLRVADKQDYIENTDAFEYYIQIMLALLKDGKMPEPLSKDELNHYAYRALLSYKEIMDKNEKHYESHRFTYQTKKHPITHHKLKEQDKVRTLLCFDLLKTTLDVWPQMKMMQGLITDIETDKEILNKKEILEAAIKRIKTVKNHHHNWTVPMSGIGSDHFDPIKAKYEESIPV